ARLEFRPLPSLLLFFLQAEDGIRDRNVTGVQTCALPISACSRSPAARIAPVVLAPREYSGTRPRSARTSSATSHSRQTSSHQRRSEERRVGKEESGRGAAGGAEQQRHDIRRGGMQDTVRE